MQGHKTGVLGRPFVFYGPDASHRPVELLELQSLLEFEAEPSGLGAGPDSRQRGWDPVSEEAGLKIEQWKPDPSDPTMEMVVLRCTLTLPTVPSSLALAELCEIPRRRRWDARCSQLHQVPTPAGVVDAVAAAAEMEVHGEMLHAESKPVLGVLPAGEYVHWRGVSQFGTPGGPVAVLTRDASNALPQGHSLAIVEPTGFSSWVPAFGSVLRVRELIAGHVIRSLAPNCETMGCSVFTYLQVCPPSGSMGYILGPRLAIDLISGMSASFRESCLAAVANGAAGSDACNDSLRSAGLPSLPSTFTGITWSAPEPDPEKPEANSPADVPEAMSRSGSEQSGTPAPPKFFDLAAEDAQSCLAVDDDTMSISKAFEFPSISVDGPERVENSEQDAPRRRISVQPRSQRPSVQLNRLAPGATSPTTQSPSRSLASTPRSRTSDSEFLNSDGPGSTGRGARRTVQLQPPKADVTGIPATATTSSTVSECGSVRASPRASSGLGGSVPSLHPNGAPGSLALSSPRVSIHNASGSNLNSNFFSNGNGNNNSNGVSLSSPRVSIHNASTPHSTTSATDATDGGNNNNSHNSNNSHNNNDSSNDNNNNNDTNSTNNSSAPASSSGVSIAEAACKASNALAFAEFHGEGSSDNNNNSNSNNNNSCNSNNGQTRRNTVQLTTPRVAATPIESDILGAGGAAASSSTSSSSTSTAVAGAAAPAAAAPVVATDSIADAASAGVAGTDQALPTPASSSTRTSEFPSLRSRSDGLRLRSRNRQRESMKLVQARLSLVVQGRRATLAQLQAVPEELTNSHEQDREDPESASHTASRDPSVLGEQRRLEAPQRTSPGQTNPPPTVPLLALEAALRAKAGGPRTVSPVSTASTAVDQAPSSALSSARCNTSASSSARRRDGSVLGKAGSDQPLLSPSEGSDSSSSAFMGPRGSQLSQLTMLTPISRRSSETGSEAQFVWPDGTPSVHSPTVRCNQASPGA